MIVTSRFGVVAACAGVAIFLAMMLIPLPRQWPRVAGELPAPLASSLCFDLQYEDSAARARLPASVVLTPAAFLAFPQRRPTFVAKAGGAHMWAGTAWWEFAGPDSVDVSAHHQALLRFPRVGGRGVAIPYYETSLPLMLLHSRIAPQRAALTATARACASSSGARTA